MMSNRSLGEPTTVGVESTMSPSFQTWSAVVVPSSGFRTVIERSRRHPEPAIQSVLPSRPRVKLTILAASVCAVVWSAGTVLVQAATLRAAGGGERRPVVAEHRPHPPRHHPLVPKRVHPQAETPPGGAA